MRCKTSKIGIPQQLIVTLYLGLLAPIGGQCHLPQLEGVGHRLARLKLEYQVVLPQLVAVLYSIQRALVPQYLFLVLSHASQKLAGEHLLH